MKPLFWSEIRAITIHQPYATEIVTGRKRFEQRTWNTEYRGLLAIHAAKRPRHDRYPTGGIVGLVVVADVHEPGVIEFDGMRQVRPGHYCWELVEPIKTRFIAMPGRQTLWPLPRRVSDYLINIKNETKP